MRTFLFNLIFVIFNLSSSIDSSFLVVDLGTIWLLVSNINIFMGAHLLRTAQLSVLDGEQS